MTPVESSLFKKSTGCVASNREPFTQLNQQAKDLTCSAANIPKPSQQEVKNIGTAIYKEFDLVCKDQLGKTFRDVLTLVPEAALQKKSSPAEARKKNREQKRKFKKNVENSWKKNDVNLHLAQRASYATRKRQRLEECFESIEEANDRTKRAPKRQKRSHGPNSIDGNLQQLKQDVKQWKTVNWSEKAKEYQIRRQGARVSPPNAGQVLKEYLKSQGVDTEAFDQAKSKSFTSYYKQYMNM